MELKIVSIIIFFGALSGLTVFLAFFLWSFSFFSYFLMFSLAPTFLWPLYFF
jgi:hypothetical protein